MIIKNLGQNLNVYFNKKLISNCIIFETNKKFIEMVISMAVYCKSMEIYGKSDSRQGKIFVSKKRKSETVMVHKNKT